ncbi:Sporulation domain protein [Methylophaga frappieri]|uniref:Sporulation domain protein n=2 Tax=Methylophaga frappieri (strain ATCC BAA-2434 / DSM 25690 / JAM7) TaxID=754477 RepID=I1YJ30_METFJ|nr:Sporulation domain protein [Methylophaga frappieri]
MGQQFEQNLNLCLHLLRSTTQIPVIVAPAGYGKTTLLTALNQKAAEDLRCCVIRAQEITSPQLLLDKCLRTFGSSGDWELPTDLQQLLRQRLQQLKQANVTPVLLIDDVDQLSAEMQQQLGHWLQWQESEQFLWRAVLTTSHVSAIQPMQSDRLQVLSLGGLVEKEISGYLLQRLQAAGWQDSLPFTEKQLNRIQRRSKGIPSEANHQAHQTLMGFEGRWSLPALPTWNPPRWMKWLPMIPVIIAGILLLVFQQTINSWLSTSTDDHETNVIEIEAPAEIPTITVESDKVTSNEEAEKQELINLLDDLEADQLTRDREPVSVAQPDLVEVDDIEETDSEAGLEEVDEVVASSPRVSEPQQQMSEPQSKPITPTKDANWVMQQNAVHYTFQLMGSWDRTEIDRFVQHHDLQEDYAIFASLREGKNWYALIYGVYPNKRAAVQASKNWAAPLSGISTWLRRFQGVQQQIKDKPPID